jgi:hypothetical protein
MSSFDFFTKDEIDSLAESIVDGDLIKPSTEVAWHLAFHLLRAREENRILRGLTRSMAAMVAEMLNALDKDLEGVDPASHPGLVAKVKQALVALDHAMAAARRGGT